MFVPDDFIDHMASLGPSDVKSVTFIELLNNFATVLIPVQLAW